MHMHLYALVIHRFPNNQLLVARQTVSKHARAQHASILCSIICSPIHRNTHTHPYVYFLSCSRFQQPAFDSVAALQMLSSADIHIVLQYEFSYFNIICLNLTGIAALHCLAGFTGCRLAVGGWRLLGVLTSNCSFFCCFLGNWKFLPPQWLTNC